MTHSIPRHYSDLNTNRWLVEDLYKKIMLGKWEGVVESYENNFNLFCDSKLNKLGETALHLAVSHGPEDVVEKFVHIISRQPSAPQVDQVHEVLKIANKQSNNPLHLASATGSLRKCICIAEAYPSLGNERNQMGESPLFLAALHGKTDIFLCLHHICGRHLDDSYYRRNGGETILHWAIKRECWDLAYQILHLHKELVTCVDEHGIWPLNLLAEKPAAFRSGCHLGWWNNIIYHCIHVDALKSINPKQLIERCKVKQSHNFPQNYQTCINFYQWLQTMAQVGRKADEENPQGPNATLVPSKLQGSDEVKKIKEKHILSLEVLKIIIDSIDTQQYMETGQKPELTPFEDPTSEDCFEMESSSSTPEDSAKNDQTNPEKKETSILIAARNGITEMVEEILNKFPMAIYDDTSEGKNIVLLAVESRKPQVYEILLNSKLLKETMLQKLDDKGNSALHLAAKLEMNKPWLIPGAALQMQWEIKWYEKIEDPERVRIERRRNVRADITVKPQPIVRLPELLRYVKCSLPQFLLNQPNIEKMTPKEIFTKDHEDLVNKGGEWLNKTSESCSVVAALIATVAFATSTAVPGGIKESGTPILETYPAFDIFAVTSLVALCFSVTALFFFLAILTSRYQENDFRSDLPGKLLLGLTSLFVSIASMLVSFCAGHFFVLKDKLKNKALPVYVVTCLPITFFAISQFPLYFDLVKTYYRKVPRSSYKVVSL